MLDLSYGESQDKTDPSKKVVCGEALEALVPGLPTTLAILIDQYRRETDDFRALHRMCLALEITVRFLAVVVLAELWTRRASTDAAFPDKLLKKLLQHFECPTLGSWRVLMEAAVEVLPGDEEHKQCLLPELPAYVKKLATALGSGSGDPFKELLPLRNLLVIHSGRISDEMVAELLRAHTPGFEGLMSALTFLSDEAGIVLVALPSTGPARLLRGLSISGEGFDRLATAGGLPAGGTGPDAAAQSKRGIGSLSIACLRGSFPDREKPAPRTGEKAIHIYSRTAKPTGVEYTTLGSLALSSRGAPSWEERFAKIFRLGAWRARFADRRRAG
jgi:hypothetical protein